ncbi:SwmB domain-containing protein, partial [Verminephrobacter aporrectodeae]|uniref:SwmB domain-containing protein n=1 Tax=Verminephrobacter aporrectodeae TaxID=1110389 RepID=UPI002243F4CA
PMVQDAAGNDAASFDEQAVTNNTPATDDTPAVADATPPVISTATVNGNRMVITYTEANSLDGTALAGDAGFTVRSPRGAAITVTGAVVDATAKTVTLTLSRAVARGEVVILKYAKPVSAPVVQDAAGNDAANFDDQAVTNNTPETTDNTPAVTDATPPVISTATVTGDQLVLTYTEANNLDGAALAGNAGFTVRSPNGAAITVTGAVVNASAKTVTLTLSRAVTPSEVVVVKYAKPASEHVVQDVAGNDAASFDDQAVTNNTPAAADNTPPVISTAVVTGSQLVLTYTEANSLHGAALTGNAGFTVRSSTGTAITVTGAVVNAKIKTVTLVLSRTVTHGEVVVVKYAKPASGPMVQDAAGNDAASFDDQAVTNNTPETTDNTPPVISTTTVIGNQLVLTYTEANSLDGAALPGNAGFTVRNSTGTAIPVTGAVVDATAKTVTLTLSRAVARGEIVIVKYAKPDYGHVVQDAAGNDAASFDDQAVTNNTPAAADTTPPVISTATVTGDQLVLTYTEANNLDGTSLAGNAGFTVRSPSGTAITVTGIVVNAMAKTVTLTLSRAVTSDETLTLSYTKPASGDNAIRDAAGNPAANSGPQTVDNLTPAPNHRVDSDGVSDTEEDQAIGPAGALTGDGNGDGIPDSAQAAVASFSATTSRSSTSLTLVADSHDGKVPSDSHTRITGLEQKAVPTQTPRALEMPIALTSFQAALDTAGSSETFSLYVDPQMDVNGYWLQDNTDTWVNLASSPYGGRMVDQGGRLRLDFQIKDGGPFDADDAADGVITAPGAAGNMPLSIVGQAPDGVQDGFLL